MQLLEVAVGARFSRAQSIRRNHIKTPYHASDKRQSPRVLVLRCFG